MTLGTNASATDALPNWVPQDARHYIIHTQLGQSIRSVARTAGCHASTVMRQVHKLESRRDDPLIDEALVTLGRINRSKSGVESKDAHMTTFDDAAPAGATPDSETFDREARRVLRRLAEPGACLAVAKDMEKAVVVRDMPDGRSNRTAVLDRAIAQAIALKEWIAVEKQGRIAKYKITSAGRTALRDMLATDDLRPGFSEAPANFDGQSASWNRDQEGGEQKGRARYAVVESPIQALSRRRDRDGAPFLSPKLVRAAERLHEDFELARMDSPNAAWESYITADSETPVVPGTNPARQRVANVLADLGPGLGDVVLRCCCMLEGMETAEKRMGWSARSGKIVLRIALQRLAQHYASRSDYDLIG
ncbi:DUF6456 domain-containing protein [Aliiroseovarius sp. PTFE2010]|uniref:DUF6456 domain-containing protein n=1 Tax=Aliiroseovarius sp. PTFE2010 TaxID=3417190 RepID=UPI003CF7DAF6